jgi:predicted Fe-Mo cluster-binding NifX family protein
MSDPRPVTPRVFCAPWFRPVIVVTALAVVGAVAWEMRNLGAPAPAATRTRRPREAPEKGALLAATAPPIAAGARAPHPNFGHCRRCHDVLGSPRAGATPVATAPPIAADAKLTHPDWGACKKCHALTGPAAAATPAAFSPTAGSLLGLRVDRLGAKQADLLEMEGVKGPLVTQVLPGSPAEKAGLKVDDAILKVDNTAVTSAAELRQALRAVQPGAKVKLQIQRGERKKNAFVRLPDLGADGAALAAAVTPPAAPPATMQPAVAPGSAAGLPAVAPAPAAGLPAARPTAAPLLVPGRVAIAATAPELGAQVAPVFSGAPWFLVRDGSGGGWAVLPNPGASSLGRGQTAAGLLIGQGVSVLIAGNVGPGAFDTLRRAGVQVYSGAFGDIERVYRSYLWGALVPAATTVVRGPAARTPDGTVAVAALGPGLGFPVAASLGRSPYLVLYDVATGRTQAIANPSDGRAAGEVQVAQLLVDRGAAAAIAGSISPAALQALTQLNVMSFAGVAGTVSDALSLYLQGRLQATTVAASAPSGAPGGTVPPPG